MLETDFSVAALDEKSWTDGRCRDDLNAVHEKEGMIIEITTIA
jgi:hypothetical protein